MEAVYADIHRGRFEAYAGELALIYSEAKEMIHSLKSLAGPRSASTPLLQGSILSSCYIDPQPLGVVRACAPRAHAHAHARSARVAAVLRARPPSREGSPRRFSSLAPGTTRSSSVWRRSLAQSLPATV